VAEASDWPGPARDEKGGTGSHNSAFLAIPMGFAQWRGQNNYGGDQLAIVRHSAKRIRPYGKLYPISFQIWHFCVSSLACTLLAGVAKYMYSSAEDSCGHVKPVETASGKATDV
jgi:hypothetical protein